MKGVGVGTEIGGAIYNPERKCMFFHSQHFTHYLPASLLCLSISGHKHTEHIDLPRGRRSSLGLCLNLSALPSALFKKNIHILHRGRHNQLAFPRGVPRLMRCQRKKNTSWMTTYNKQINTSQEVIVCGNSAGKHGPLQSTLRVPLLFHCRFLC